LLGGTIGGVDAYSVETWYEREADSEQFKWWQAYYNVEPWGSWRDNLHAGVIAQAIHATNPNGPTEIDATKFILPLSPGKKQSAADLTERAFMNLCLKMGGKIVKPACPPSPISP
jgi:hypothetical protein